MKLGNLDTRTFRSKVARRTFTLFIACALIPVSALALLSLEQVTTQLNEQSQQRLHQATKAAALGIYQRLLGLQEAITLTASGLRSRSGPTGPRPDARVDEELQRRFKSLLLVTDDGTKMPLFGHLDHLPVLTTEHRRHLASGKTLLLVEHVPNRPPRLVMGRVRDPERPHREILYAEIDPAYLWDFGDDATLASQTKLSVVDQSLNLLFASPQAPTSFPEPIALQLSRSTSGRFEWSEDANEYVASYWALFLRVNFSTPKWTIVLSEARADVLAPIASFKRTFFLVVLLSVWIVLLLSITQIRKSLIPLEKLQEGTRRIARGDFDTRVEVASRDEFQELAVSLNTMAHQLGRQFTALTMMGEVSLAVSRNPGLLEEVLRQCADILVRHLDLAAVRVWVLNSDDRVLELRASAGLSGRLDGAESRIPLGHSAIGQIAEERRPRVTNALVENSGSEQAWAAREGLVAFVGHPLLVEGRLVGVAAAYARTPLDDVGLSGFVSAAGEIAQCIERQRVEEALRGSEEQVRQLQKMEAVGRLAGGVAHDFNNLLTVITGHSQLLLRQLPPGDPLREGLDLIEATAVRAGWLTRQLLAFSRKQNLAPVVLDPNDVVSGMATMLERLIGDDVELVFRPDSSLGRVRVDSGQLEQVIVNLVVNARDAMPEGGRITIETADVELDAAYAGLHFGVRPGSYVMLAVTDTGIGMGAETQSHIFEPFFTTKEPGKGTGLGLATVYGIVKQSDGHIRVQSQPGEGTTFKIYFPLVDAPLGQPARAAPLGPAPEGAETILLVEDQADVRLVVRRVLQNAGYIVLDASTPGDALELAGRHTGPIHVMLTDIVMPQMNGRALAALLKRRCPAMRVLYMSGYADTVLDPGTAYLQKPFTPDTLVRTVREVLDTVVGTSR